MTDDSSMKRPAWPEIMTTEELAGFLRLNRKTIYEAIARGEIPHQRVGRSVRFEREAILAWLRQERDEVHLRCQSCGARQLRSVRGKTGRRSRR